MKHLFFYLSFLMLVASCAHKSSNDEVEKFNEQFQRDEFGLRGEYHWNFQLMGGTQHSVHTLYEDSIAYSMEGRVYSTDYTMQKLSFDKTSNKWIGRDESGIVYVLFFKDKTDSTLTIYKRKCKTNGLEEALRFKVPAADATEDHGWNVYALDGKDDKDVLPVSGSFANTEHEIVVSDSLLRFDQKEIKKVSFHSGERRWVGEYQDRYLQVFFKSLEVEDSIRLSATWFTDAETMYNTKYSSIRNWEAYARQ
jgi:hypothetical protein